MAVAGFRNIRRLSTFFRNCKLDTKSVLKARLIPVWSCRQMSALVDDMVERGVYIKEAYRGVAGCQCNEVKTIDGGKLMEITWGDGSTSRFHSVWLRHMCHCSKCKVKHTGQPQVDFDDVNVEARLETVQFEGDAVTVTWEGEEGHIGIFPTPFLKANCYSRQSNEHRRRAMDFKFKTDGIMPQVDYNETINSDLGIYNWLSQLSDYGICLMKNVPIKENMVKEVAEYIAPIQQTVYGVIFDVYDTNVGGKAVNQAYTNKDLALHMDLPYYESPPGLQFLHCLRFEDTVTGGLSLNLDLIYVAEMFRQQYPEDFDILCRVPTTFETIHYNRKVPVHMRIQRPMIVLNHFKEIVAVTWHPLLNGPLFPAAEEDVEPYFRAFKKFYHAVKHCPLRYEIRLRPGDLLGFVNRRMLHGRSGFIDEGTHGRWLQGTFVNIDEFKSRLQYLSNTVGNGEPVRRVGNQDWQ